MKNLELAQARLHSGDVLHLTKRASVQFASKSIMFRLIRILPDETYDGWCWIEGYELNEGEEAVDKRRLWVQYNGVNIVSTSRQKAQNSPAAHRSLRRFR